MKKTKILFSLLISVVFCFTALTGCFGDDGGSESGGKTEYTVQYADDEGTHSLTVKDGALFSLEKIPSRFGYTFKGLYDAETGGTQIVGANGSSLAAFSAKSDLVLYPQFEAKEYNLYLEVGADAEGEFTRSQKVKYDEALPALPTNLTAPHKEFSGWYTAADCGGEQVSDRHGYLPGKEVLNQKSYSLADGSDSLTFYAGFNIAQYDVTLKFGNGIPDETVRVAYGTPVRSIAYKARNNKQGVLTWSKEEHGSAFAGNIEDDITLYATEWAPAIELDANGGKELPPVVARAGETVQLPAAERDLYLFLGWEYAAGGSAEELTAMPAEGASLKAKWQAKLVFDENGGEPVEDISEAAGTSVTLPVPTREGYLFAGWYTSDKQAYTRGTMPSSGVALKAGWYKEMKEDKTVISSTSYKMSWNTKPSMENSNTIPTFRITHNDYAASGQTVTIRLEAHVKIKTSMDSVTTVKFDVYSKQEISSSNLLETRTFENVSSSYREYTFSLNLTISDDVYICWYTPNLAWREDMYLSDYYRTLYYPDTSTLYL